MKPTLMTLLALLVGASMLACDSADKQQTSEPTIELLDTAAAEAQFRLDIERAFESSYTITYDVELDYGPSSRGEVTWYKDKTERQRFDLESGIGFANELGDVVIFIFGDRDRFALCSENLPQDPEADPGDGDGACYDDGDGAGNAIYTLGFPLEYPDTLPSTYFEGIQDFRFNEFSRQRIAGRESHCYSISIEATEFEDARTVELCYASTGGVLRSTAPSVTGSGETTLFAKSYAEGVRADDFALPFELIELSDE